MRENPLKKLRLEFADQRRERRLRPGELDSLLQAAQACRNAFVEPIIRLALATGMRRSEILAIRPNDLDLAARTLVIPGSKNGSARHIPLSAEAVDIVRHQPVVGDRLFPITSNGFRLAWVRLTRRAGITDLHFHDLRHEAISRFFEIGLSVPEVALISGHREIRMLLRYTHPARKGILAKMDAHQTG